MLEVNFEYSECFCPCHCNNAAEGSIACTQQKKAGKEFINRNVSSVLKVVSLTVATQNPKILCLHSPRHQSIHEEEKMGCVFVYTHTHTEQD